jgi:hypothetical protein
MSPEPIWMTNVRDALRSHIGALAYVVIEETLESLGISPEEMNVRKMPPFLAKLKDHLPAELDREALIFEVGRIMLDDLVRTINHKQEK